ncbi:ABC transporter substrate-binding protein [Arcobacter sp. CECT 8983]|uniref:substrate-binding periplasmic protein n=1 Tax=Arcobacter sp. CECT 8983 TaxID=2044508 RepID=UPI0013E95475|nr:transporter substrate-binding domain-containing protein [Arcobacter sp. CECT 8983]
MKTLFILLLFINILFSSDQIQPLTESWAPYQIENKNGLSGISIDLIKEIQKRLGNKKEIKLFPWKRAYNITLRKKGYALFLTSKSKEREKLFKWIGPIASIKVRFFKNASRKDLDIKTLEDAKKVDSIIVEGDTITFDTLKMLGFKNLDINTLANNRLNKLLENKTDLLPADEVTFIYNLKQKDLDKKILPVKMEAFFESKLYIAFNKDTSDDIIKDWKSAFEEIKADGTYDKILERY